MFIAGAYDRAYELYRQELFRARRASPRMLLRMAYAQEGLGHYPAALYYLSLAEAQQPRLATHRKMTELAQNHRLTGYSLTWQQRLFITLRRYHLSLLQGLLSGAVAAGVLLLLRRRRGARGWWLAYGSYLAGIVLYLNLMSAEQAGLVARPQAALMAGPSAGAPWLTTAAAGDRLVVRGQQDIWYRVRWRGRDAYIRRRDLVLIN